MAMNITGIWEGTIDGTNWGRLLVKLEDRSTILTGFAQITDVGYGTYTLDVRGTRDGTNITLHLTGGKYNFAEYPGTIHVALKITNEDLIEGEWKSTIGTYGTLRAERHDVKAPTHEDVVKRISGTNAAFIVMAFSDQQAGFLPVVDILAAIKRACTATGVTARRVDEVEHSGSITAVILEQIKSHRFLISDLTHQRQNVYYEIGYAHGLGKEVILTAQKNTQIHFDIAGYNVIFYASVTELEERIIKRLRAKMTREELQRS